MALLCFLAAVAVGLWPFLWVLGPVDRAAEARDCPVQFNLADLFCLFVMVQVPLGIVHWRTTEIDIHVVVIFDLVLVGLVTGLWWAYVRALSRAGINVIWQRCAILVIALPVATAAGLATIHIPFAAFDLSHEQCNDPSLDVFVLLGGAAIGGVAFGIGYVTRAIVASATDAAGNDE